MPASDPFWSVCSRTAAQHMTLKIVVNTVVALTTTVIVSFYSDPSHIRYAFQSKYAIKIIPGVQLWVRKLMYGISFLFS